MVSKAFSFRLPDEVVEALESQGLENETLNQTAQRVLTESLGFSASLSLPKRITGAVDIQNLVKREVESAIAEVRQDINQEVERILATSTAADIAVDNVDIQDLVNQEVANAIAGIGQAMVKREVVSAIAGIGQSLVKREVASAIAEVKQDLNERLGELAA
ncbi:hypothetical protein VB711_24035 [Cronbergia sp. UHCC 0137]|uniref:hypothetical protein n=1 Tax=Cronbergia sp. UHCC 0137 TaxID=3110239 RepID=UPI002B20C7CB|nr:hypothetical protein [Cronbergia sp. UHCC 0137]MEA5620883.1 hypothetical protein [Cronbergia sp. UHCC 0137]